MCGRYVSPDDAAIEREFTLVRHEWQIPPSYNVAPTQDVPIVRVNKAGERAGVRVHWGLIPFWAKGVQPKYSTINATVEKLTDAATWRGAWKRCQRCILPALGFFEWVRHEVASVIVRRTPFGRTCRPIGSTLRGMAAWQRAV